MYEDPQPYRMPDIRLGDTVYWFPSGNLASEPQAAFVTRIGHDTVCLNVLSPNSYTFVIKDGVRHVSDPKNRTVRFTDIRDYPGAWDHSSRAKELTSNLEALVA